LGIAERQTQREEIDEPERIDAEEERIDFEEGNIAQDLLVILRIG
jgi:hypothetical protein